MERQNAWKVRGGNASAEMEELIRGYRAYLDGGKTERECVTETVALAEEKGWRSLKKLVREGSTLKAGDRVYLNWMGKCAMMFIVGQQPMEAGMNILGAHIDSPRIDIKQNPMYEDSEFAYLDTHYYGYIKKYQWVARPLALHGVIALKNGRKIQVTIGEKEEDPVFYISDLLPHIADEQLRKTASKVVEGEDLDIMIGHAPLEGEEKEAVRANVLKILKAEYGIEEEDFLSAELEAVPADKSHEVGFDRGMISGYGHDDRVCAYPSMRAMLDFEGTPEYTLCCVLADKEEIGSYGATGMHSAFFENAVAEVCALTGDGADIRVRRTLQNSRMLSSDVSSAFDPLYPSVFEKKNTAFLGHGVCFNKYTGSGGKGGSSDANAEYVAEIRRIMDGAGVNFQTSEIGKVDCGGGGTIAHLCAQYGMNVIDAGIPVLSMHSPCEVISKIDLFEAYKCYCAFLKDARPVEED